MHRSTQPFLTHVVPSFFANGYYRLAGCKIGKNVNLNTITLNDPSLVEIGDNVVIGGGATLNGHLVERNRIVLEKITIGHSALVGGGSMVGPGSRIGNQSVLASRAVLPKRKVIPDNETWGGFLHVLFMKIKILPSDTRRWVNRSRWPFLQQSLSICSSYFQKRVHVLQHQGVCLLNQLELPLYLNLQDQDVA